MARASDNSGVYPYPLIQTDLFFTNPPAPERATGEYTGALDDSGARVKGFQPGFDYPGTSLMASVG
jgi:hypothetical protein